MPKIRNQFKITFREREMAEVTMGTRTFSVERRERTNAWITAKGMNEGAR
jgi:hypothetical protein